MGSSLVCAQQDTNSLGETSGELIYAYSWVGNIFMHVVHKGGYLVKKSTRILFVHMCSFALHKLKMNQLMYACL